MRHIKLEINEFGKNSEFIKRFTSKLGDMTERSIFFDLKKSKAYCRNDHSQFLEFPFIFEDLSDPDDPQENFFCDAEMFLKLASLGKDVELKDDIFYFAGEPDGDSFRFPIEYETYDLPGMFDDVETSFSIDFNLTQRARTDLMNLLGFTSTTKSNLKGIFVRDEHLISSDAIRFAYWDSPDLSLTKNVDLPVSLVQTILAFPLDNGSKISAGFTRSDVNSSIRTILLTVTTSEDEEIIRVLFPGNTDLGIPGYNDEFKAAFDHDSSITVNSSEFLPVLNFVSKFTSPKNNNRFQITVESEDEITIAVKDDEVEIIRRVAISDSERIEDLVGKEYWYNASLFVPTVSSMIPKDSSEVTITLQLDPNSTETEALPTNIRTSAKSEDSHTVHVGVIV